MNIQFSPDVCVTPNFAAGARPISHETEKGQNRSIKLDMLMQTPGDVINLNVNFNMIYLFLDFIWCFVCVEKYIVFST